MKKPTLRGLIQVGDWTPAELLSAVIERFGATRTDDALRKIAIRAAGRGDTESYKVAKAATVLFGDVLIGRKMV